MIYIILIISLTYLYIQIFIQDKKKQFDIILSTWVYKKNDIICTGKSDATVIILDAIVNKNHTLVICYPIKRSKYKFINLIQHKYIRLGYYLRTKFKKL